jgi:hypothetical protein
MIKEPKGVDFHTSGRQLSSEDFALISQWIAADKQKQSKSNTKRLPKKQKTVGQIEAGGNNR